MKARNILLLACILIITNQSFSTTYTLAPSSTDVGFKVGIGAGTGLAYGTFGIKGAFRYNQFELSGGLGIMPLSWDAVTSVSGTYMFDIGQEKIIPKISLVFSDKSAMLYLYDQSDLSPLYKAYYPGIAPYFGMYLALDKEQRLLIDMSVGYIFTFEGNRKVADNLEDQKKTFEQFGYSFTKPLLNSLFLPKMSFGLVYFF